MSKSASQWVPLGAGGASCWFCGSPSRKRRDWCLVSALPGPGCSVSPGWCLVLVVLHNTANDRVCRPPALTDGPSLCAPAGEEYVGYDEYEDPNVSYSPNGNPCQGAVVDNLDGPYIWMSGLRRGVQPRPFTLELSGSSASIAAVNDCLPGHHCIVVLWPDQMEILWAFAL